MDSIAGTITRTYDDRFDSVTQEVTPQGTVNYTYDVAGRRATMTVAGQTVINYTFDNADRLTQIAQGASQITLAYDNASRRQSLTLPNGVVQTYAFDNANQLTGITYSKSGVTLGDLTYGYDVGGRRTLMGGTYSRTNLPAAVTGTSANAMNQLTAQNGATLTYDSNGNLTNDGINTYTWDARNQLTSISGAVTASFQYDAFRRRQSKTVGGTQTGYVYDGWNFVQERNGGTVSANLLTGLRIDETYSRTQSATTSTLITDGLGSTLALTDGAGNATNTYTYGPYGVRTVAGLANSNSQQYSGREDDGTGLMYYRARYYHPVLARFISEDPIGLDGGINSYIYVGAAPMSRTDPLGLWSFSISAYAGFGGAVSFGRDPVTGGGYFSVRAGYGTGGGASWNPDGGRPGSSEDESGTGGWGAGAFAESNFNAGPVQAAVGANAGVNFPNKKGYPTNPYTSFGNPEYGFGDSSGFRAEAAAGVEITFFSPRCP